MIFKRRFLSTVSPRKRDERRTVVGTGTGVVVVKKLRAKEENGRDGTWNGDEARPAVAQNFAACIQQRPKRVG